MSTSGTDEPGKSGGERADPKARRESPEPTVSKPGGFKNDPDDPNNPCEVIERTRRTSLNPKSKSSGSGDPNA